MMQCFLIDIDNSPNGPHSCLLSTDTSMQPDSIAIGDIAFMLVWHDLAMRRQYYSLKDFVLRIWR